MKIFGKNSSINWRTVFVCSSIIIGLLIANRFGEYLYNHVDHLNAQAGPGRAAGSQSPQASPTSIPAQCEKFYNYSMDYLKQVETAPAGAVTSFDNYSATKSAMYGIAYQNCVARDGK